jgi:hypothetical protein
MKYISMQQQMLALLLVFALGCGTLRAALDSEVATKVVQSAVVKQATPAAAAETIHDHHEEVTNVFYNFFDFSDGKSFDHHMQEFDALIAKLQAKGGDLAKVSKILANIKSQVQAAHGSKPLNMVKMVAFGLEIKHPLDQLKKSFPMLEKTIEKRFRENPKYGSFSPVTHFSARING